MKHVLRSMVLVGLVAVAWGLTPATQAADEKPAPTVATKPVEQMFSGQVTSLDLIKATITVEHKKTEKTFTVAKECKFTGGKDMALTKVRTGDQVRVTYTGEGDKLTAIQVKVSAKKDAKK